MDKNQFSNVEKHIKILAWLTIGLSILALFGGLMGSVFFAGMGVASGEAEALGAMMLAGLVMLFVIFVTAIPGMIAGWGLLQGKEWARVLTLIIALLNLMSFPFGTILGAYAIWVLAIQEGGREYFLTEKTAF